jgi:putative ABC transport system permease protein
MRLRRILLKLSRRHRLESDMEAELAFHREMAREHANPIGLGNVPRIQEEARDLWRFTVVEDLWRDVRYGVRSLGRTPGFAVIAILTLALGIGANSAIFTLIHRVMLAPLPVRQPDQLIEILGIRGGGPPGVAFSYAGLQNLRRSTQTCSSIIGFSNIQSHTVIEAQPMERVSAQLVTGDFFSALDVATVRGRPITPQDDQTGNGNTVAVISHSMWQSRFGGDPNTVGKTLTIENVPFTIVGIAPAGFYGIEVGRQNDIWIPLESERRIRRPSYTSSSGYKWLQMVGRLKPSASLDQAQAELSGLYHQSIIENEIAELREDPRFSAEAAARMRTWSLTVAPAWNGLSRSREEYSRPLQVLMAIVGALLLIACTNVANLLFARALGREKEIALRLSLGAGRRRLIRQLLTESSVLVGAGGALALFVSYGLTKYLTALLTSANGFVLDVAPDPITLGFTAGLAIFAVVIFGLMPAFRSTDMDFANTLKGSGTSWLTAKSHRWSSVLTVVQVAVLLVLVLAGGLFVRTLHNLNAINLGFDRSNVLVVTLDPFGSGRTQDQLAPLSMDLVDQIQALPGVRSAAVTRFQPISNGSGINLAFTINRAGMESALARDIWVNSVGPNYFATLRIPLVAGREFTAQDSNSPTRVVIVNQAFAERYFGKVSPIGKTIATRGMPMEIVGLVRNAKYSELRGEMEPTVYQDVFQQFSMPLQFLIRTERDPKAIAGAIRAEFRSLLGNVTLRETTLADHIDASIVRERMVTTLAAVFGGLALLLAVIGLYGVVNNSVARRTREIGIRMALGFDGRRAVSMVLREVLVLVGAGIVLGLPLGLAITRSTENLLYGLQADDPSTVIGTVIALILSALAAGFIPARRAARVDPINALRTE